LGIRGVPRAATHSRCLEDPPLVASKFVFYKVIYQ
jgi:hypothetical protein